MAQHAYINRSPNLRARERPALPQQSVDLGAIDLIEHGSPEAVAKHGLVLAPLDAPGSVQEPSATDAEEDPAVKEIEKCFAEWHTGSAKRCWIFLIDSNPTGSEHLPPYIYIFVDFSLTTSNFDLVNQKHQSMDVSCRSSLSV